ncbi:DNA-binding protein WhiA [Anaerococcus degeneri]|uniref:Probable cell division protein WhiA n=2 Tax=Anaerococcus TaxID=165779 RepID=A0ABS7YV45_9FIRM|nr:DNA-binding protein WhiA [Anaerococcus degeneri]MBP2015860.1 DNA-binding protein WhiA [Anaerococcus degeneri]MCA2095612.1 DNA-binding protein WhiA [Anaerococcus degeneri]
MSFSQRCKKELLKKEPIDLEGELISLAHFIGSIRISSVGFNVIFKTDSNQEARYIYKLIADLYGYSPTFEIQDNPDKKNKRDYVVIIEDADVSDKLISLRNQSFLENYSNIEDVSLDQIKGFLKIAFIFRGSVNDPQRGYNLEIVGKNKEEARIIKESMDAFNLNAKVSQRLDYNIIYLKDSDKISDFLVVIGAMQSLFELENVRAMKSIRNDVNRVNNFDNANIDRTVKAARAQLDAINKIIDEGRFDEVDDLSQKIGKLRLENPYLSLDELGEMLNPPLSKAKINYRLQKFIKLAKDL